MLALTGGATTGPANFDAALPSIARVDLRAAKAREEQAIGRIKEHDAKKGKGVGKEAQDIFDALDRTYVALSSASFPNSSKRPFKFLSLSIWD